MLTITPRTIQRFIILFIFLALCTVLSLLTEYFLTPTNISNVLQQISTLIITSCGATLVMIGGGIDLSVGGVVALSGVLSAGLAGRGLPLPVCFLAGILAGTLVGMLNGFFVSVPRIIPIIATLGTMWVSRGIAYIYTTSYTKGALSIVTGIPAGFRILGRGTIGTLPVNVLISLIIFVLSYVFIRYSVFGLRSYSVGCNEEVTRRFGIETGRHKFIIFTIAGTLAGLSGVLLASRLSSGEPSAGLGFEFDVIVAVILGGTSLHGGEGTVSGTLIGALFVGVLYNALNLLQVQTFYRYLVLGGILISAVIIDEGFKRRDIKTVQIRLLRGRR
jgi:ribose/xylose/arabinose/galactoside ABC-type transport system permease subunit